MEAVALDPNAGKQNPAYAQMLNQAMQNRASEAARRRENDEENVFKARDRDQQARRDRNSNEISKRNASVNEASEKRLQGAQDFDQSRLKLVDDEHLLDALHKAEGAKNDRAVDAFSKALRDRGYKVEVEERPESDEDFNARMPAPPPPAAPPPAAKPPVDRSPVPPRSPPPTARFPDAGEAEAAPPMRGAPAGVGPRATASFPPTSGAPPPGAATPAPNDGIPLLKKTQDMSWTEGKQPPLSMPPRQPPPAPPRASMPPGARWPAPPPTDDRAFFEAPFDRRGLEAGLDKVTRGLPSPAPPPPDRSVYGESVEDFEQNMGGPQLSDTDLLNMAISKVVKSETGRDMQIPPTRSLLPARMLRLKGTP